MAEDSADGLGLPAWVKMGAQIQKKPCGVLCRVQGVGTPGALVHNPGGFSVWISGKTLKKKWKPAGPDPLQELLKMMRDGVCFSDLHPSLSDLREKWIDAGCPGLDK